MLTKSNERSFNCYAIHLLFNLLRRSNLHFVKNKKLLDFSRSFFVDNTFEISNISFTTIDFELIIHMIEFILEFDKIY